MLTELSRSFEVNSKSVRSNIPPLQIDHIVLSQSMNNSLLCISVMQLPFIMVESRGKLLIIHQDLD